jgi:DNA-binding CsgD family transcriptional regulator
VIIGRSIELDRLDAVFREGVAAAVLVGGEAGVGKTRLIREFAGRAEPAGARVLVGGCLELGTDGLPFAPFTAALRQLVREIGVAGVAELMPGGSTSGLGRLLPEFGEAVGDPASGEARVRLFELVRTLLERLAADRPLVLVVEDAHWADRSTRDLLTFLIRNLYGGGPLMIVVTYRTDELHRSHPLRPLLTELDRVEGVWRLELSRLGRTEVAELVSCIHDGESPLPGLVDDVFARSEGNPLFVEALLGDGGMGGGDELPESLRDLLLAGVQRLPDETQDILRVASAGGARIEHRLLAAVAGLDEATLTRGLRPAVAANVLVVEGDGYSFRHALIREAIHDDLLPGEHTRLHTRYAETLAADPGLMPARQRMVELAHHWYLAHDQVGALISAWQAVAATRESLAYAESLQMAARVLELWEKVPDAAERIQASHLDVLAEAVELCDHGSETELGIKFATSALKEVDEAAEPMRAALFHEQRGRLLLRLGRQEGLDDLRAARRLVPADPPTPARAKILATLAIQLDGLRETEDESREAGEEGVLIARAVGDIETELQFKLRLSWLNLFRDDDLDAALALNEEATEGARRAGAFQPLMRAHINASDVLEAYGRSEEAIERAQVGMAEAERYGLGRTWGTFLALNLAESMMSLGRWAEALTVIDQALARDPYGLIKGSHHYLRAEIAVARGDLGAAAPAIATARRLIGRGAVTKAQDLYPVCRVEAELLLAQGRADEAAAAVRPVMDGHGLRAETRYGLPAMVVGAVACTEAGDPGPIAELRAWVAPLRIYGPVQRADLLTFNAEAALAEGTNDPVAWREVVAAWDKLGRPYPLARALLRAAEAELAEGGRDRAEPLLRRAAEITGRLGAAPLAARIDDLARRSRVALSDTAAATPRLGLTPREQEVLRLVAEGRSNREIADALFISSKTASVHVSNILAKLGVSGRGEAAATAHRLHLFDAI